jgi:hypothetical protein
VFRVQQALPGLVRKLKQKPHFNLFIRQIQIRNILLLLRMPLKPLFISQVRIVHRNLISSFGYPPVVVVVVVVVRKDPKDPKDHKVRLARKDHRGHREFILARKDHKVHKGHRDHRDRKA